VLICLKIELPSPYIFVRNGHVKELKMTTITCLHCGGELDLLSVNCPNCGNKIKPEGAAAAKTKTRFLKPTKLLGALLVALSLGFFVSAYMTFSSGKTDVTITYSIVGLALGIWGGRAFGIML